MVDVKYGNHLANFFILHPTFWLKFVEGLVSTFMIHDTFLSKLRYIDNLEDIYNGINREQLHIPEEIIHFDTQLNGRRRAQQTQPGKSVATASDYNDDL